MAILKSSLEEPLLTREQMSIIRDIAHAAQIAEAYNQASKIKEMMVVIEQQSIGKPKTDSDITNLLNVMAYLKAEALRVLMQIKVPRRQLADTKADTKISVNEPSV
jgi:hypothetical protein